MIRNTIRDTTARNHYDAFLAGKYAWMAGGTDEQIRESTDFFRTHGIVRGAGRAAIDLGAGCGFQAIPLARAGFAVTAVDFCGSLLDELRQHSGSLPIVTLAEDIRNSASWTGLHPALIVCMGDTLTHLSSMAEVRDLVVQCASQLGPGRTLVLSFRDYTREPPEGVVVIPVRRGKEGIFLCRLEFHPGSVSVRDILYSRRNGRWGRECGEYAKIRIDPAMLNGILEAAGFSIGYLSTENGTVTIIARRETGETSRRRTAPVALPETQYSYSPVQE